MPHVELRGGEVDGLSLHYTVDGHGPAVVLVHGLGGFAESWRHTIPALATRATVYAVDLPGFGRSAKPRAPYGLTYFAAALHGFMNAVGIPRASLVGHSLGGAVSVTLGLTHPSRVERIALLGAVVPGFPYRLSWIARLATVHGLGEVLSLCGCAPLYRASIARCFSAPIDVEIDFLVRCHYTERTRAAARSAFLATARDLRSELTRRLADYRRAIATLDLPVLLIHGRQDPVVPASHCQDASSGLPSAVVRWIDRCGHFPHIEHAPIVNGWLMPFLVGRPAPR
jgi:pimeloyl-ACP methyl ester carboxylesterase